MCQTPFYICPLDKVKLKGHTSNVSGFLTVAIFEKDDLNYANVIVLQEYILF